MQSPHTLCHSPQSWSGAGEGGGVHVGVTKPRVVSTLRLILCTLKYWPSSDECLSLSLVFLLATIITFVTNKYVSKIISMCKFCVILGLFGFGFYAACRSLWNMRNYIHVMLCVNLFAAQLVFVVEVERTENKVFIAVWCNCFMMCLWLLWPAQVVCSAIAVLLHYMWLVVFMWMLMEGVFLYVALVRVFVSHTGRYIAGFTITSYG